MAKFAPATAMITLNSSLLILIIASGYLFAIYMILGVIKQINQLH